jgi:hypothetical protein
MGLKDWPRITDASRYDFWSGRIQIYFHEQGRFLHRSTTISLFGVKLDPVKVREHFPEAARGVTAPQLEKYERKTHVTTKQMQAWHAAFKAVYGGTARDVVPFGVDSARGFFRDKEVSREDVRKAMSMDGPRPRGPKITKT